MQLKYVTQFPWSLSIIGALENERYQSLFPTQMADLASFLSIDQEILLRTIEDLCHLNILKKVDDKYELEKSKFQTGNLPIKEILKPIHYWTEKVAQRISDRISSQDNEKLPGLVYFSDYRVMSVSQSARDEINKVIAEFVGQVKAIFENQKGPKNDVCCLLLHHFQPGITKAEDHFENDWIKTRPESLYWSKRFHEL